MSLLLRSQSQWIVACCAAVLLAGTAALADRVASAPVDLAPIAAETVAPTAAPEAAPPEAAASSATGKVTDPFAGGATTTADVTHCGGAGQPSCCIGEGDFGHCKGGLVLLEPCTGPNCACGVLGNRAGMCENLAPCGGAGQRGCLHGHDARWRFGNDTQRCANGLMLVPGCSGDCRGRINTLFGDEQPDLSLDTCMDPNNFLIAEPTTGKVEPPAGSVITTPACSMSGYADMHMHMFGEQAHGGAVLAGKAYDRTNGVNGALAPDFTHPQQLVSQPYDVATPVTAPTLCNSSLPGMNCHRDSFHLDHDFLDGDPVGSPMGTQDGARSNYGAPVFSGWPRWSSTTHQQVYYTWLERAWQGGLRLITQLAVTNEAMCRGNRHLKANPFGVFEDINCFDSMQSIDNQIEMAYAFQEWLDLQYGGVHEQKGWFRIVKTPFEARKVISQGKLAVVLGIEVAEMFNCYETKTPLCTEAYVNQQVDHYYDLGVRHVFPIHNFDNAFGSAATWQRGIEVGQRAVEGRFWHTEQCAPTAQGQSYGFRLLHSLFTHTLIAVAKFSAQLWDGYPLRPEAASCNSENLTELGRKLNQKLMDKGMIIDVDHMSNRAFDQTLEMANENPRGTYPVVISHALAFELYNQDTRHERLRTREQLQKIRNVGGMVAAMLKDDLQDNSDHAGRKNTIAYPFHGARPVEDNCRYSSRTFANAYQYLVDVMQGSVAFGSDFNGIAGHFGPRFGSDACGGWPEAWVGGAFPVETAARRIERSQQILSNRVEYPFQLPGFAELERQVTGQRTYDVNLDGLAHVGLLPDFVEDLNKVGLPLSYQDQIFRSAEAYVEMWERATATTEMTWDDTPPAAAADICAYIGDPHITFAPNQALATEQVAKPIKFSVNKGWTVQASCGPAAKVLSQTLVMSNNSNPAETEYTMTCTWAGGSWGGPQGANVTVIATDPAGQFPAQSESTSVFVSNVPAQFEGVQPTYFAEVNETFFESIQLTDAPTDVLRVTENWGDGSPVVVKENLTAGHFFLTHKYMQAGTFNVQLQIQDEISVRSVSFQVVANVGTPPLSIMDSVRNIDEGTTQIVRLITDDTQADIVTLDSFTCGTGGTEISRTGDMATGDPAILMNFECRYDDGPSAPRAVAVISDKDGSRTDGFTFNVRNLPPTLVITPPPAQVPQGQPANLTAQFGDPGLDTVDVTINWGDGFSTVINGGRSDPAAVRSHIWQHVGTFTITVQAQDSDGATTTRTATVTVSDTMRPFVSISGPSTVEATSAAGALIEYAASAWDNVDGDMTPKCSLASGVVLPIGTHPIECFAYDTAGNSDGAIHIVHVVDTKPPMITITAASPIEATGPNTPVAYTATATDIVDGAVTPTCAIASGTPRPLGETTIACNAVDNRGNATSASTVVVVHDTTAPSLTTPTTVPLVEAIDAAGAPVSFATSATDIVDQSVSIVCTPASGAIFVPGTTPVSCTATDDSRNFTTAGFNVVVADKRAPEVTVPGPITVEAASSAGKQGVAFSASAIDNVDGPLSATCSHQSTDVFPLGLTSVRCAATDDGGNEGFAVFTIHVVDTTAPVVTAADAAAEAGGPTGATVSFATSATDAVTSSLTVTCNHAPGSLFGLGSTTVTCSATDAAGNTGSDTATISVVDTIAPVITGQDVTAIAPGPLGVPVAFALTAADAVSGNVAVSCTPGSGAVFPLGATPVECSARDAYNNTSTRTITVTVLAPTTATCFTVDFREITYFNRTKVITSSDATIRQRNGIAGAFNPSLWPYSPNGKGQTTKSLGTLFRLYGFAAAEAGRVIYNADDPSRSYVIRQDASIPGAYYADLEGPARVSVCANQLHDYVLAGEKGNGHKSSSQLLPAAQRNVPGVMLTRNSQILKVPTRVKRELRELGLPTGDKGLVDYIGVQLQGNGNEQFREFVDVEVAFPWDSEDDRLAHYKFGFHTAANTNFESFAGCNYLDNAPGNDSVRLHDLWGPNRSNSGESSSWRACGRKEPRGNQEVRTNYDVPFNAIQLLPTVNGSTDTLRLFFGPIRPVAERELTNRDRHDWRDWDDEDEREERRRNGRRDRN